MTRLAKVMCRGDDRASRRHRTREGEHSCQEPSINGRSDPAVHDRDPEVDLEDLCARNAATRWPERETVEDQSQGVQLATMQRDVPIAALTTEGRRSR
jgi:hypothetical protein